MNKATKKKFGIKRRELFNKKLAIQILLSIVIVAAVIVTKQVDTGFSKQFINAAEDKIDKNINPLSFKDSLKHNLITLKDKIPFISKKETEFAAPVNGKIYQKYGIAKNGEVSYYNHGLDILSKTESVKSISKGNVLFVGKNEKLSNYVIVQEADKKIIYGCFNEVLVQKGDSISKGDIIGALNDENKILHLEVWENGESINPTKLFDISD